jgi:hypothetical protein
VTGGRYRRLTVEAKQRRALERLREPGVRCPRCETETTAADLMRHVEGCQGPREPHPMSQWITRREAVRIGVPDRTLRYWRRRGLVRSRGGERQYLLRDVMRRLAARRAR